MVCVAGLPFAHRQQASSASRLIAVMIRSRERPEVMNDFIRPGLVGREGIHLEVFFNARAEPIRLWCDCEIAEDHTYEQWRQIHEAAPELPQQPVDERHEALR